MMMIYKRIPVNFANPRNTRAYAFCPSTTSAPLNKEKKTKQVCKPVNGVGK